MIKLNELTPENRLGRGSESSVYARDATTIVRVYRPGVDPAYIATRHAFYHWLDQQSLPFATPHVIDAGMIDGGEYAGQQYSVEARMPGHDMAQLLPSLHGAARAKALRSYLAAAIHLGTVHLPDDNPYGELAALNPVRRDDWRDFLLARIGQSLQVSADALARDVPDFPVCLAAFERDARALSPDIPKRLVHGDYLPANVFMDDDLIISGVGDFGYSTVAGDPRLDLMGALCFIELVTGYDPADSDLLQHELVTQYGPDLLEAIAFYRRYAAFYFSPSLDDDPTTYAWCVATLTTA